MAAAVEKSRAMYDPRSTMFPYGAPVLMQTDRTTPVSRDRKVTPEPRAAGSVIVEGPCEGVGGALPKPADPGGRERSPGGGSAPAGNMGKFSGRLNDPRRPGLSS